MNNFEYTVRDGDTLQLIAQNALGDASRWIEIAILNDLDYPFITRYGEGILPNTKTVGDTIILPNTGTTQDSVTTDDLEASMYGSDILLSDDTYNLSSNVGGEIVANLQGDITTVSGIDSLLQDLTHRLITEQGTLPYHQGYGSKFMTIIGNRNDSTWRQKASIEAAKTFRTDPRVVDVQNVVVTKIDEGVNISCVIVTPTKSIPLSQII